MENDPWFVPLLPLAGVLLGGILTLVVQGVRDKNARRLKADEWAHGRAEKNREAVIAGVEGLYEAVTLASNYLSTESQIELHAADYEPTEIAARWIRARALASRVFVELRAIDEDLAASVWEMKTILDGGAAGTTEAELETALESYMSQAVEWLERQAHVAGTDVVQTAPNETRIKKRNGTGETENASK